MLQKVIDHEKIIQKLNQGDIFNFVAETRENKIRVDKILKSIDDEINQFKKNELKLKEEFIPDKLEEMKD